MGNETLRDYLKVIFRHKFVVVATVVLVTVLTFFKLQFITPYYTASVDMLVKGQMTTEAEYYQQISTYDIAQNHAILIKSRSVLERVVNVLELYKRPLDFGEKRLASRIKRYYIDRTLEKMNERLDQMGPEERKIALVEYAIGKLFSNIETVADKRSNFINIIVKDSDPNMAALIGNSISRSYLIFDLEQQIAELKLRYGDKNATIVKLKEYIDDLYKTLDGRPLPQTESFGAASIKVTSQAMGGGVVKPAEKTLIMVAAFLASIVLGFTFAFIFEFMDQTFKTPREVEAVLNIPVIGSIPSTKSRKKTLIKEGASMSDSYVKSFHALSDQMSLLMRDSKLKTILIVDAENSRDTANIIANLAKMVADKAKNKVLIVDANFRSSSVSGVLGVDASSNLIDLLEKRIKIEDAVKDIDQNLALLSVSETGYNPIMLLNSHMFGNLIQEANEKYDMVFISCSDLVNSKDAVAVSSVVDGIVVVINEGKARRLVVKEALTPLRQKQNNIIGVILNNRSYSLPKFLYRLT